MEASENLKALRRLSSVTTRLHSVMATRRPTPYFVPNRSSHNSPRESAPVLKLNFPSDVTDKFLNVGCSHESAHQLTEEFLRSAKIARTRTQQMYDDWHKKNANFNNQNRLADSIRMASVAEQHFERQLKTIEKLALERARELAQGHDYSSDLETVSQRPTFNQQYVPVLETYFQRNAYPSASHRTFLAQHTKMTVRQIVVWFQNHRNRAKKEGRQLMKNPDIRLNIVLSPNPSPPTPSDCTRDSPSSEANSDDSDDDESTDEEIQHETSPTPWQTFSEVAPDHAFPGPYPPVDCGYDPFPVKRGKQSFSTPWYRKPSRPRATKLPKQVQEDEIEDLCGQFMVKVQGRFVNRSDKKRKRKRRWDVHLRTIPEPSPLPSLISQPVYKPAHSVNLPKPKPAPESQVKQAFLCSGSSQATLVPPRPRDTCSKESTTGRWITRLSLRSNTLGQTHTPSRASTPSTPSSVGSPLFSPAPSSRRRRLEEDSSEFDSPSRKRRRTSLSSSSSSSSLSSTLTTPQLGPTKLPHDGKSQLQSPPDSEFDFSSLQVDGLLGDIRPPAPLTATELFHFGFQPPTTTAKDMSFDLNLFESTLPARSAVYAPS